MTSGLATDDIKTDADQEAKQELFS